MKTQKARNLSLPPVALNELSGNVKDFLIASSVAGKSIPDVVREILVKKAIASGFLNESRKQASSKQIA